MIQNYLVKILLAPVSLLYGIGVSIRDFLYRKGLLKGVEFNLPVISVGNLSVGGAGKTPHIEYLIRLLKDYLTVSTLSRGYKRKTKGFLEVQPRMNAEEVGDEPLQFKRKYPDITVTVSESRTFGIPQIVSDNPAMQVVLLDDAFQHRSVKPGLNILLTEYSHPFTEDYLMPSGRLREWRSAYSRADVIIVSKCPPEVTEADKENFRKAINPFPHQKLFFSYYGYGKPYFMFNPKYVVNLEPDVDVLLICAIARTDYLVDYLETQVNSVQVIEYEDHHFFNNFDVAHLLSNFEKMESKKKVIITTEKDAMRLELHRDYIAKNQIPIFALPVEVRFHYEEGPEFDQLIKDFLLNLRCDKALYITLEKLISSFLRFDKKTCMQSNPGIAEIMELLHPLSLTTKLEIISRLTEEVKADLPILETEKKNKSLLLHELYGAWEKISDHVTEDILKSRTISDKEITL